MVTATAPLRARCPRCYARFDWPDGSDLPGALLPGDPPLEDVACPRCRRVIALEAEPCDEKWWAHLQAAPS